MSTSRSCSGYGLTNSGARITRVPGSLGALANKAIRFWMVLAGADKRAIGQEKHARCPLREHQEPLSLVINEFITIAPTLSPSFRCRASWQVSEEHVTNIHLISDNATAIYVSQHAIALQDVPLGTTVIWTSQSSHFSITDPTSRSESWWIYDIDK